MPTEMYFVLFPSVHLPAKFSYKTKIRFEHALPKQTKFSNERKKTNLYGKNKQNPPIFFKSLITFFEIFL